MISKLQRFLIDERIHAVLKYSTPLKFLNLFLLQIQKYFNHIHLIAQPIRLTIEPTDICNLKCTHCLTGIGTLGRKKGTMAFSRFKEIIDHLGKNAYLADIYDWGEPFLNREVHKMIRYAEDAKICTTIHSNFNITFNEEIAEDLIRSGLSYLTLSLDGADQEVYQMYRKDGDFNLAIENAKILIRKRKELNAKTPTLIWQFLVFPHNKHQLEDARIMAGDLGFDLFRFHKGFSSTVIFNYDLDKEDKTPRRKDINTHKCDWLWTNATFRWDGKIASCVFQYKEKEDFADSNVSNFKQIWNNDNFQYARSLFTKKLKDLPLRDDVICTRCFKVKPHLEAYDLQTG